MEKQTIEATSAFISPEERARLVQFCARITKNVDAAEDLAQETLLEAWLHEHNLRNAERRAPWLFGIARSAIPLGLIVAALGGSAFVGTFIFGAIGHHLPRRLTFGIGYTLGGSLRFWVFLLVPVLPFLIAWHIIAGLAIAPINPLMRTVMQERLPAEMRARVFGTMIAGSLAGIPLGTLLSGYVVTWFGLQATISVMGALYLIATLSLLINPALKRMEKPLG